MKSLSYLKYDSRQFLVIVLIGNMWVGLQGTGINQNRGLSLVNEVQAREKYQTPDQVRVAILDELKASNDQSDKLLRLLKSGDVTVKVARAAKTNKR